LWLRGNFARILPNLRKKCFKISDLQEKSTSCHFGCHVIFKGKAFNVHSGAIIFKSKAVGRHFCSDFQGFFEGSQRFCPEFRGSCPDVMGFCLYCLQTKTFGGVLATLRPAPVGAYTVCYLVYLLFL